MTLQNFCITTYTLFYILQKQQNLSNMVAGGINTKQIPEDLKSFLTKEMENNAKKITEKIMDTKFDEIRTRIKTIDRKAETAETLAKQNQNNTSNLTGESTALQEKLVEQAKKA